MSNGIIRSTIRNGIITNDVVYRLSKDSRKIPVNDNNNEKWLASKRNNRRKNGG